MRDGALLMHPWLYCIGPFKISKRHGSRTVKMSHNSSTDMSGNVVLNSCQKLPAVYPAANRYLIIRESKARDIIIATLLPRLPLAIETHLP